MRTWRHPRWTARFEAALLAVGCLCAVAARVDAQVVTVISETDTPLLVHVVSELSAKGYTADVRPAPQTEDGEAVAPDGTPLCITLAPDGERIVVTAGGHTETVTIDAEGNRSLLALRAVELLRALATAPQAPLPQAPSPVIADRKKPTPAAMNAPRFAMVAAPVAGVSFGGLSPTLHLAIGLTYRIAGRFGLSLTGLIPTFGMTATSDEGEVSVKNGFIGLSGNVRLLPGDAPVQVVLGLGAAPLFITVEGRAESPYISHRDTATTGFLFGSVAVTVPLVRHLAIRIEGMLGESIPDPVIRSAGLEVVSVARPMLFGLAGLEVGLF